MKLNESGLDLFCFVFFSNTLLSIDLSMNVNLASTLLSICDDAEVMLGSPLS